MKRAEKELLVELLKKAINEDVFFTKEKDEFISYQNCCVFIDENEDVIVKEY